jgi:hypothetical protein
LARKYADNGGAVAKQIECGFYNDADRIPVEIIADYVARISTSDALFNVAREIERVSCSIQLPSYDQLSAEARSLLGVMMDFNGISREKIATAWPGDLQSSSKGRLSGNAAEAGPLFQSPKPAADTKIPSDDT